MREICSELSACVRELRVLQSKVVVAPVATYQAMSSSKKEKESELRAIRMEVEELLREQITTINISVGIVALISEKETVGSFLYDDNQVKWTAEKRMYTAINERCLQRRETINSLLPNKRQSISSLEREIDGLKVDIEGLFQDKTLEQSRLIPLLLKLDSHELSGLFQEVQHVYGCLNSSESDVQVNIPEPNDNIRKTMIYCQQTDRNMGFIDEKFMHMFQVIYSRETSSVSQIFQALKGRTQDPLLLSALLSMVNAGVFTIGADVNKITTVLTVSALVNSTTIRQVEKAIRESLRPLDRKQLYSVYSNTNLIEEQLLNGRPYSKGAFFIDPSIFALIQTLKNIVMGIEGNSSPSVNVMRGERTSSFAWVHIWIIALTFRDPDIAMKQLSDDADAKLLIGTDKSGAIIIHSNDLSVVLKKMLAENLFDLPDDS